MKEYSEKEIEDLIPMIKEILKSKEFKWRHFNSIMPIINNLSFFDPKNFLDSSSTKDIFEDYMEQMSSWEKNQFMHEHDFMYASDYDEPYTPSNLMEEQVDELLAQIKAKYDYLPHLEKALGTKLVAEVRGFPDPEPQPDLTNENPNCYCSKVIDLESYEIEGCCERNGKKSDEQWLAANHEGDFFCTTCDCGKVSKPYLKNRSNK